MGKETWEARSISAFGLKFDREPWAARLPLPISSAISRRVLEDRGTVERLRLMRTVEGYRAGSIFFDIGSNACASF